MTGVKGPPTDEEVTPIRPAIRSTLLLGTCAALAIAAGPPAEPGSSPVERGMPPERVDKEPDDDMAEFLRTVCDDPIESEFVGAEGIMALPRFDLFTAPGLRVTRTNLATDASVSYTITGTFRDVYNGDGTMTSHAAGTNLLYGWDENDEPFLLVTRGKATLRFTEFDEDGLDFGTFTVDARHIPDVCEVLS